MNQGRLEAFSDGVIAIIITIMVLEMKVPHGGGLKDLAPLLPVFLSYVLSFFYVGIYWNNHHHMLHACSTVNGAMLWANLHLLFWLSLFPFATGWMGENHFTAVPTALYGVVLLMAAHRILFAATDNHSGARAGFNPEEGSRPRLERQAVAAPVCPGNRCRVTFFVGGARDLRGRRVDLADPGSAHQEASCLIGKSNGGPGRSRTADQRFRKPLLYPSELRGRWGDYLT